ncbi:hypothetical protein N7522_010766 [Penicillium canescens]|nr:hypothetical protein N7522_010766 [Penicillium canescens]
MHESMLDTWLSLNINDSGLTADMTVPPTEREEATEMTLCLIRCEIMRIVWKPGYLHPACADPVNQPKGYHSPILGQRPSATVGRELSQALRYHSHYFQVCDCCTFDQRPHLVSYHTIVNE